MKVLNLVVLSSLLLPEAFASVKVIYGEDNRLEVYEASPEHQAWARAAATMISGREISPHSSIPGMLQLKQTTLRESMEAGSQGASASMLMTPKVQELADRGVKFCDGTRFVNQPNAGMCSGFLIAPDLIVTAGHCVELENFCEEFRWVFDFKVNPSTLEAGKEVKPDDVYQCKKVINSALSGLISLDYALIQLDRPVSNRLPLSIRNTAKIGEKDGLVVIGSPSGLPLKVAGGANVRTNTHPFFFSANLDTFQGNSGSPVFNSASGVVEGILVRGEEDYVYDPINRCLKANQCDNSTCRGEDVSRMVSIPEVAVQKTLYSAAENGNVALLEKLKAIKFWIDFYGVDGQSALLKASAKAQAGSIRLLLAQGASVNLQDADGNTALHLLAKNTVENSTEALAALLEAKADLEIKNSEGDTALSVAIKAKNQTVEKLLLEAKAKP